MKRILFVAHTLAALLLTACSTTPPSSFYTLDVKAAPPLSENGVAPCGNAVISVGPIELPDALQRPQIVTRQNANRLHFDEFHRWAGQLDADVATTLTRNLAMLLATERIVPYLESDKHPVSFRVEVNIEQFDGALGGEVTLAATWTLLDLRAEHRAHVQRVQLTEPVAGANYDALVAAHSNAIAGIAAQIAHSVAQACAAPRAVALRP